MSDLVDGGGGALNPNDRTEIRDWWHKILRNHDKYPCYAILLALPSDMETTRYLTEFGREIDLISGKDCLVLALGGVSFRRSGFDDKAWGLAVKEHITEGYSMGVAQLFKINITEFPCLVIFQDIRSPSHIIITLKGMTTEEIAQRMRVLFSIIQQAVAKKSNILETLQTQKSNESLLKAGQSIIGEIQSVVGKTFQTAVEVWIKAFMESAPKGPK